MLFALIGPVLHGALLIAPLACLGMSRHALGDPAVLLFLVLISGFYLADLPTLSHAHPPGLPGRSAADRLALRWGLITGLLLLATFWTALLERTAAVDPVPNEPQACGALLMLAGVAIRAAAVLTLGRAFVTEIAIDNDRPLIQHGIYAWVRHPSETGNLAVTLGTCLLLEGRLALILASAVLLTSLRRIHQEDRSLADAFGPRFRRYAEKVGRLIPLVY